MNSKFDQVGKFESTMLFNIYTHLLTSNMTDNLLRAVAKFNKEIKQKNRLSDRKWVNEHFEGLMKELDNYGIAGKEYYKVAVENKTFLANCETVTTEYPEFYIIIGLHHRALNNITDQILCYEKALTSNCKGFAHYLLWQCYKVRLDKYHPTVLTHFLGGVNHHSGDEYDQCELIRQLLRQTQ